MQQRRLRLGDILDDYCPRERRITNHAVVAMIEDEVKQTRCTTCDADHEYKQARVPVRRKKDAAAVLGELGAPVRPRAAAATAPDETAPDDLVLDDEFDAPSADTSSPGASVHASGTDDLDDDDRAEADEPRLEEEDGPVHRRLIRATLPRPEGQAPEWKDPEFTIRQPGSGRGGFDGNRNGQRPGGGGAGGGGGRGRTRPARGPGNASGNQARFGGPRQGNGGRPNFGPQGQGGNRPGRPGQGQGPGQSRGPRQGGHGRKRGR